MINIGRRFSVSIVAILIAFDQLVLMLIMAPWYTITGQGRAPDPDETISGWIGRNVIQGHRWATVAAVPIDFLFRVITLGRDNDHCRDAAIWEAQRRCVANKVEILTAHNTGFL